jgi:hypothetical protein
MYLSRNPCCHRWCPGMVSKKPYTTFMILRGSGGRVRRGVQQESDRDDAVSCHCSQRRAIYTGPDALSVQNASGVIPHRLPSTKEPKLRASTLMNDPCGHDYGDGQYSHRFCGVGWSEESERSSTSEEVRLPRVTNWVSHADTSPAADSPEVAENVLYGDARMFVDHISRTRGRQ